MRNRKRTLKQSCNCTLAGSRRAKKNNIHYLTSDMSIADAMIISHEIWNKNE